MIDYVKDEGVMKITIIGPVYPYKGGISHYTGLMCKNLRERHEVDMITYSLQYPKILFRKPQKDFDNATFSVEDTQFILNTANPLSWRKTAERINKQKPDLVIVQWWHPYFSPCYTGILRRLLQTKVICVCHNVFPHERFPLDRFLTKRVLKKGNGFIVHSEQDASDLLSVCPGASFRQTVLPTYDAFRFAEMGREEARSVLGIAEDARVLLFFGLVRKYKGLQYLLRAMPAIRNEMKDVKLLIVGDFGGDKDEYLSMIDQLEISSSVEIFDGYMPDKEVQKFFAASDLVVLPYVSATQSAVVQIAYGLERPVLVTKVGGLPEVVSHGKTGYVVSPEDAEAIAEAVSDFYQNERAADFETNVRLEAEKYSWKRMRETIENLYQEMCGKNLK